MAVLYYKRRKRNTVQWRFNKTKEFSVDVSNRRVFSMSITIIQQVYKQKPWLPWRTLLSEFPGDAYNFSDPPISSPPSLLPFSFLYFRLGATAVPGITLYSTRLSTFYLTLSTSKSRSDCIPLLRFNPIPLSSRAIIYMHHGEFVCLLYKLHRIRVQVLFTASYDDDRSVATRFVERNIAVASSNVSFKSHSSFGGKFRINPKGVLG